MAKKTKWLPWLLAGAVAGIFLMKKKSGAKLLNRFSASANAQALNPNLSADKTTQITEVQQVVQDGGMSLDDPNLIATKTQQIKDYK